MAEDNDVAEGPAVEWLDVLEEVYKLNGAVCPKCHKGHLWGGEQVGGWLGRHGPQRHVARCTNAKCGADISVWHPENLDDPMGSASS